MKPSQALQMHRALIRSLAVQYHLHNPRVFGSVLNGTDAEGSDLDILVDPDPERTTLFELDALQDALSEKLGIRVDIRTPAELHARFRDEILREAQPV